MYELLRSVVVSVLLFGVCLVDYSFELNTKIVDVALEHPKITYENPKYLHIYNLSSNRLSRRDHMHYIELCLKTFVPLDANWVLHIHIYEWMGNEYKPSFVQVSFKLCDFLNYLHMKIYQYKNVSGLLVENEIILAERYETCKSDPDIYCLKNATLPTSMLPPTFPFQRGRIFINATYKNIYRVADAQVDLTLKLMPLRKGKN